MQNIIDQNKHLGNSEAVKQAYKNFLNLHSQIESGVEVSVDKFLNDGLLVALNRQALGIKSCKGKYYNLLFKWTEDLAVDGYLEATPINDSVKFDHSLFLLETKVPIKERKKFGEHYTPPEIVDYIIHETLTENTKSTLDPAVGSGAFLTGWLNYQLKNKKNNRKPKVEFTGYDINPTSLAISELNLDKFFVSNESLEYNLTVKLELKDSLKEYLEVGNQGLLNQGLLNQGLLNQGLLNRGLLNQNRGLLNQEIVIFDAIVGNPPYVRVQNIQPAEKRDMYRFGYPESAVGRFDLYMLFIDMGGRALKQGGRLGYIVSNKLMTSNAAKGIRSHITRKFAIEHVVDLGDSKLFQAAVLPVILILKIKESKKQLKAICANVKEVKDVNKVKDVKEVTDVTDVKEVKDVTKM